MGYLAIQGGAEFGGQMKVSDQRALSLAGGISARISIIPAAAAPDANHHRAGELGRQWFCSLGARRVTVLPIVDRSSADDSEHAGALVRSRLIYILGGFPGYLVQTMVNTSAWGAIEKALKSGAVVAGSSAGAMVLCQHLFDPEQKKVMDGLGLLPNCCVLPHHNRFGQKWAVFLQKQLPGAVLIGIDEQTGAINDGAEKRWTVYGAGAVTLYRNSTIQRYTAGATFSIKPLSIKD